MHTEAFRGKMLKHLYFVLQYFSIINLQFWKSGGGGSVANTIAKKSRFKVQKSHSSVKDHA